MNDKVRKLGLAAIIAALAAEHALAADWYRKTELQGALRAAASMANGMARRAKHDPAGAPPNAVLLRASRRMPSLDENDWLKAGLELSSELEQACARESGRLVDEPIALASADRALHRLGACQTSGWGSPFLFKVLVSREKFVFSRRSAEETARARLAESCGGDLIGGREVFLTPTPTIEQEVSIVGICRIRK